MLLSLQNVFYEYHPTSEIMEMGNGIERMI